MPRGGGKVVATNRLDQEVVACGLSQVRLRESGLTLEGHGMLSQLMCVVGMCMFRY